MASKKPSEVCHVIMHWVTIAIAHVRVAGIFLPHEGIRVLPYLIANSRVVLEVSLQSRMVPHEISIVQQGRVFAYLLGNFTMSIEESIKTCHVSAIVIVIRHVCAIVIAIWPTNIMIAHVRIAGIFLPHECVRVLSYLIADSRVVLEVSLQSRMVPHEIPIV